MAATFFSPADRAERYRQLAADIRARAASIKTPAARNALAAVADDYELLAHYAQSLDSTWKALQRRLNE